MRKGLLFLFTLLLAVGSRAQVQFPAIDVQHYTFAIRLNDSNDTIQGAAVVTVRFLKAVKGFQLNLVKTNGTGKGMKVSSVNQAGHELAFGQDSDILTIHTPAKANSLNSFKIIYKGVPADGLIISENEFGHRTFFGDNWPNRAHNWLPCADYPADKAQVDFIVTAPDHYKVVANGLKIAETPLPHHLKRTHWKESVPLPTKVMVIGVADFAIDHPADIGKIPLYTYVFPESKDAGFKSYQVAKEILPYYIKMVGPYAYEKLANVQSKTIFGGMEMQARYFILKTPLPATVLKN